MPLTNGPFLVLSVREERTRTGKRYLTLQVKNERKLGGNTTNAKIWEEVLLTLEGRKVPLPVAGQIWETATYDSEEYNNHPQFIFRTYKVAESTPEMKERFREPSVVNVDEALMKLLSWKFWPPVYRQFFLNLTKDLKTDGMLEKLKDCPAGAKNHHDRRGGLLQHVCEMVDIAATLCQVIETDPETKTPLNNLFVGGLPNFAELEINFPLLRAAIIMHDMGKIHDYKIDTMQHDADLEGKALQHSQWGILAIERCWPTGGLKQEKLMFQHAVLAHHGKSIAPVAPQTVEASLLHQIDAISAYLDVHRTARRLKSEGKAPPYNMMLGEVPLVPDENKIS